MLLDKIEQLPAVQAARAAHAREYEKAEELEMQAYAMERMADIRLMKTLGKHYLGAWWEFEGKFRDSCGYKVKPAKVIGYCPVETKS